MVGSRWHCSGRMDRYCVLSIGRSIVVILISLFLSTASGDVFERRLYEDLLLKSYDPLARPVKNSSEPVWVSLGISLQQILDVDEKNQIIQTNIWLTYKWQDYNLQWDPAQYGGVEDVRIPADKGRKDQSEDPPWIWVTVTAFPRWILLLQFVSNRDPDGFLLLVWKPDVLLYNSVDQKFDSTYPTNIVLYHTGMIDWIPPGIVRSSCSIQITWFPFDDQVCFLKFGSWTYSAFKLNLQLDPKGVDTSEYLPNGEWLLLEDMAPKRFTKTYECCPTEPYPTLMFYLHIRRRTLYYGFNLIIPSLLISIMTILGFTLPPESGEKITLEITILISICFLLNMVADMTPPTSDAVPVIGVFFCCCNVVVSASVVSTVVVLNLHHRTPHTHKMSPFVRSILLNWLPWLLMMKRPGYRFSRHLLTNPFKSSQSSQQSSSSQASRHSESLIRNVLGWESDSGKIHKLVDEHRRTSIDLEARVLKCLRPMLHDPSLVEPGVQAVLLVMQRIHSQLKFITKRMEEEDEEQDAETDWKFAAMVVDRLCLYLFTVFITVSTVGIMFSAPHLIA